MEPFYALILSLQLHSAVLDLRGPFATQAECRDFVAKRKDLGAGCIPESGLRAATTTLFNKQPSEIWK